MSSIQYITGEFDCYITCIQASQFTWVILSLIAIAIFLFIAYLFISKPENRVKIFATGQVLIISSIWLSFSTMTCNSMISMNIYLLYTLLTLCVMFLLPRIYDRYLIRRLNALPISGLMGWTQQFVDELVSNTRVFYYDSAVPKAFSAGKSIFISVGMLELLNGDELKAVLAHESWHIMHNYKTHWLKQLSLMTFTGTNVVQPEIEQMADNYASNIVGPQALISARSKIF